MKPEQRATAFAERLEDRAVLGYVEQFARVIRAAENEALERAASIVRDRFAAYAFGAAARPGPSTYQDLIRALKTTAPRKAAKASRRRNR